MRDPGNRFRNAPSAILANSSGFTLVEVIITGGVMMVVGLGMATMISNQNKATRSISATVDRNSFKTALTGMLQNADNCKLMLDGHAPYTTWSPATVAIPSEYKVLPNIKDVSGNLYAESGKNLPGNLLSIGQMHLRKIGAPVVVSPTVSKQSSMLHIPMKKARVGAVNGTGGEINVGGDEFAIEYTIPITLTVNSTSGVLVSCASSDPGCTDPNSIKTGDGSCRKVTCAPPQFVFGSYVTASGGHAVGDAICANPGDHYAGMVDGNPVTCPRGSRLKMDGTCTATSICGTGQFSSNVTDDGSATCCSRVYAEDPGSPNNDFASVSCGSGYYMSNVAGGCMHYTGTFKWLKTFDSNGSETGQGNLRTVRAQARCDSSTGTQVFADCCIFRKADYPSVVSPQACDPPNHMEWDAVSQSCQLVHPTICPKPGMIADQGTCTKNVAHEPQCTSGCSTCSYSPDPGGFGGVCTAPASY